MQNFFTAKPSFAMRQAMGVVMASDGTGGR
jgi:hypothetical protein